MLKLIIVDANTIQITNSMNTIVGEMRRIVNVDANDATFYTWDVYYDGEYSETIRHIDEFVENYTRENE